MRKVQLSSALPGKDAFARWVEQALRQIEQASGRQTDIALGGTGADTGRAAAAKLGVGYALSHSGVQVAHTGDTNEFALATVTIPAGAMGANGSLRFTAVFSHTNSVNNKTLRARLGGIAGTAFFSAVVTATDTITITGTIHNRNAENSQVGHPSALTGFGTGAAVITAAIDTSADTTLVLSGQLASAGEAVRIESSLVELFYQA